MAGVIYAQTDYGRQGNTAAPPPTPADNTSSSNPPSPPAGNTCSNSPKSGFFQYIRDAWNSLTISDLTVGVGAAGD
ncbi:unnamed protein product [Linum trigynum]|uniref:Uncharacterized protein n=1 Tax=Linum trigynum TaxID=586398 RepID=A0AAV2GJY7_9ROSI